MWNNHYMIYLSVWESGKRPAIIQFVRDLYLYPNQPLAEMGNYGSAATKIQKEG